DDALRALTVTPARLLGIDAMAGTIEVGKLANIVVVRGNDIFGDSARVREVFIEGVRYDVPAPRPGQERAQRDAAPTVAAGTWTGEIDGSNGLMAFTLTISGSGAQLTGQLATEMGNVALTGSQTGSDITLSGTFAPPGMNAIA